MKDNGQEQLSVSRNEDVFKINLCRLSAKEHTIIGM
jgi:hypothetical protein